MINKIKNKIRKYTKLLIRIDDITENMNWKNMDKCEKLFDENDIKPLLGVIPLNQDPGVFGTRWNTGKKKVGKLQCMDVIIYILKNLIKKTYFNMEVACFSD